MNERPDDIPGAVRIAFSTHRTASAWNRIVSGDPNERLAALLGFERLLAAQGLGLADVATAIAALPAPSVPAASKGRDPDDPSIDWSIFAGFGGGHSKTETASRSQASRPGPHHTRADPEGRTRKVLSGPAVPETVVGRIRIEERRPTRGDGEVLVFVTETEDRTYGPMAAYAGPQIAHLVEAERSNWILRLMIERTQSDRILPKVRRLETV